MGNYISCTLSSGKNSSAAKVIFPTGETHQYNHTIQAAELMFEMPSFFLSNTKSLQIGRRFSPLNADEDLEMANVYAMFPMKRLNSMVTAADMGVLFLTANSAAKRVSYGSVRILPEAECVEPLMKIDDEMMNNVSKLNLDDIEEYCCSSSTMEFQHRRSSFCRSKKPLLETIAEEPVSVCSS